MTLKEEIAITEALKLLEPVETDLMDVRKLLGYMITVSKLAYERSVEMYERISDTDLKVSEAKDILKDMKIAQMEKNIKRGMIEV